MFAKGMKHPQLALLCNAFVILVASHAVPAWLEAVTRNNAIQQWVGTQNMLALWSLLFSVVLIAHDPAGYGLRVGDIRRQWKWVVPLCIVPLVLTWIVYPRLPVRPFTGDPMATWLISPLAQDMLFAGYFYRQFEKTFPGTVSKSLPFHKTILVTAAYFSVWHAVGLLYGAGSFVYFQMVYTFFGACLMGAIRQYTDSFIYITAVHIGANFIAVCY